MASIAYENILRFSQDCLRLTLTRHFQSCENEKNVQLATCYSSLHQTVCHSQLPSLSRQNIQWMLHPHTLPTAAGQCYSYIIAADRTDGQFAICDEHGGCVWEAEGRSDVCAGGRVSLQSLLVSLPPCRPPPSARRQLTGPVRSRNTDGQTGGRPSMRRHSLIAGVRLHTKTFKTRCCSTTNSSTL